MDCKEQALKDHIKVCKWCKKHDVCAAAERVVACSMYTPKWYRRLWLRFKRAIGIKPCRTVYLSYSSGSFKDEQIIKVK